jgi:hypothetical protein
MGWFDGWFSSQGIDANRDPLQNLDPKLREFLERESPVKIKPSTTKSSEKPAATGSSRLDIALQSLKAPSATSEAPNGVPRESLFQDGRYSHLWKTYRPAATVEAEFKTDHEKLMDVLDGYRDRKAQIGRAALENCADEQLNWRECMTSDDWTRRMTMCRIEVRKFERCYNMQSVSPVLSEGELGPRELMSLRSGY